MTSITKGALVFFYSGDIVGVQDDALPFVATVAEVRETGTLDLSFEHHTGAPGEASNVPLRDAASGDRHSAGYFATPMT